MAPKSKEAVEQRLHSGMLGMVSQARSRPRRAALQQQMGSELPFHGEAIRAVPSANRGEAGTSNHGGPCSKFLLHGEATGTLRSANTGEARTGFQCGPSSSCHNRPGRRDEPTEQRRERKNRGSQRRSGTVNVGSVRLRSPGRMEKSGGHHADTPTILLGEDLRKRNKKSRTKVERRRRVRKRAQRNKGCNARTRRQEPGKKRQRNRRRNTRGEKETPQIQDGHQIALLDEPRLVGRRRKARQKASDRKQDAQEEKPIKHKRQRSTSSSDDPSPIEIEGGQNLKVGRKGDGKYKVLFVRVTNK
jgi:hypothetical protein